tara:strand:+ start:186 stop:506 length:321 start_codon:yes stop_codon:yes gene_type:complete
MPKIVSAEFAHWQRRFSIESKLPDFRKHLSNHNQSAEKTNMYTLDNSQVRKIMKELNVDATTVIEADNMLLNEKGNHTEQEVRDRIKNTTAYYGPENPDVVIKIPW